VNDSTLLDFETTPTFTLTVEVEDSGMLTDTAEIIIDLSDVNEAPTISGGSFVITENVANGTPVGTVITTDVDANDTFTYTITVSNANAFAIGSNNGNISVSDSTLLDFETTPTYTLTVEVEDSGMLTDTAEIIIDLLDENDDPILSPAGPFDLPENSTNGTAVGSPITATDDDISAGDILTYTITAGDPGGIFGIGASNGQISVTNSILLDFDTPPSSYTLTVQVADTLGATDVEDVVINLTDINEPPVTSDKTFNINENSSSPVGFVLATDPEDDPLNFAISGGNTNDAFALNFNSGQITVNDVNQLDFETTPAFTLTVTISDSINPAESASIFIKLGDRNEVPMVNGTSLNIDENSINGTAVGTVAASDPDVDDIGSLTFGIISGDNGGAFTIANNGSNNGSVTVANSNLLDYETTQTFTLGIIVTDTAGLDNTTSVTIDINNLFDEDPTVNNATFFVAQGSANGVVVGTVSATDPEFGSGDALIFSIIGGDSSNVFAINSSSGQITVPDTSKLDANTMPVFNLTVQALDQGGNPDTGTITINVSPLPITYLFLPLVLNDYPPIEPNNNCSQAYGISKGTDYEFTADDTEDWYAVTLNSSGNLTAILSSFEPAQGQLIIYGGSCSNLVFLQNNGSPTTIKTINLGNQPAGTYYIRVYSSPITNTTYNLRVN
ncbi:MAG: cadherin repeat domain-containing protein, partial [Chloroflexi bacterium]|nr:cadherin repeat domain-containing protein [Chloroflexota bacterium]